jgi:hypothetical protein
MSDNQRVWETDASMAAPRLMAEVKEGMQGLLKTLIALSASGAKT